MFPERCWSPALYVSTYSWRGTLTKVNSPASFVLLVSRTLARSKPAIAGCAIISTVAFAIGLPQELAVRAEDEEPKCGADPEPVAPVERDGGDVGEVARQIERLPLNVAIGADEHDGAARHERHLPLPRRGPHREGKSELRQHVLVPRSGGVTTQELHRRHDEDLSVRGGDHGADDDAGEEA